MAKIAQRLFSWEDVEPLGDLDRLRLVLEHIPDQRLMARLEQERGRGRNDYPVRGVWNSILAGVVFQHPSIEGLRRELQRNGQLRYVCGMGKVPPSWVYTRFLKTLAAHGEELDVLFQALTQGLAEVLPGWSEHLALDSKGIRSFAWHPARRKKADGRRDTDADYGRKQGHGPGADLSRWFGYKLHLVVDTTYELPAAFSVTPASVNDIKAGRQLLEQRPDLLDQARTLAADKGYDSGELNAWLWDEHRVKSVIPARHLWRDGEASRLLAALDNVAYDQDGTVSCYCPETGLRRAMAVGGFEKDRNSLRRLCPARMACKGRDRCPVASGVRIPLDTDRRLFTPVDRQGYAWHRIYASRCAIERVHSRLDVSFGFELHTIRGLAKMHLRCALALSVMLAMALGRTREKRGGIRSLVA